jgi:hypothetical protein
MIPPPSRVLRRWVYIDVHSYMHDIHLEHSPHTTSELCSSAATGRRRAMCLSM